MSYMRVYTRVTILCAFLQIMCRVFTADGDGLGGRDCAVKSLSSKSHSRECSPEKFSDLAGNIVRSLEISYSRHVGQRSSRRISRYDDLIDHKFFYTDYTHAHLSF